MNSVGKQIHSPSAVMEWAKEPSTQNPGNPKVVRKKSKSCLRENFRENFIKIGDDFQEMEELLKASHENDKPTLILHGSSWIPKFLEALWRIYCNSLCISHSTLEGSTLINLYGDRKPVFPGTESMSQFSPTMFRPDAKTAVKLSDTEARVNLKVKSEKFVKSAPEGSLPVVAQCPHLQPERVPIQELTLSSVNARSKFKDWTPKGRPTCPRVGLAIQKSIVANKQHDSSSNSIGHSDCSLLDREGSPQIWRGYQRSGNAPLWKRRAQVCPDRINVTCPHVSRKHRPRVYYQGEKP